MGRTRRRSNWTRSLNTVGDILNLVTRLLSLLLICAAFALPLAAQSSSPDVALRAGDVIEIYHWRDETMRGAFPVEEDGSVVLPLLGRRAVTGAPWSAIRDTLAAAYARELREGDIRLVPRRRVFVLGFVETPGVQFADPTVSIAGAIALAGGAAADGDLSRIRIMRNDAMLAERVAIDSPVVGQAAMSGDQIYVGRRGWFDRNSAFMVSAIVGLAGIIVTLLVAR